MGKLTFILIAIAILVAGLAILPVVLFYKIWSDSEPPELPDTFWGPKLNKDLEDTGIRQIDITVGDDLLNDLWSRLKIEMEGARSPLSLEGTEFQYGFNDGFLSNVTRYWLTQYDWKTREKLLNKYPHYLTTIAGLEIHFQHIKPPVNPETAAVTVTRPLLLLHGWPGSFVEFQKVIPLLTDPINKDLNFELIIPSLPGYGFSEQPHKPGLGPAQIGQLFLKLMQRLGHEKFYVHGGGDFGSWVGSNMATMYPHNVMGIHLSPCVSFHSRSHVRLLLSTLWTLDIAEFENSWNTISTIIEESGHLLAKPDTVGIGLSNSPSGLAAYILEKFSTWTNIKWRGLSNGGLVPYFNMDELLDNVMIYWVTNSITATMRLYTEGFSREQRNLSLHDAPVKVPTGCLQSPNGLFGGQDEWTLHDKFPQIVHFTKGEKGGHFMAFEFPQYFVQDIYKFFNFLEASYASYDQIKE